MDNLQQNEQEKNLKKKLFLTKSQNKGNLLAILKNVCTIICLHPIIFYKIFAVMFSSTLFINIFLIAAKIH